MIQIDGTIKFDTNVRPIEPANTEPLPNKMVNVTGWGALRVCRSTI